MESTDATSFPTILAVWRSTGLGHAAGLYRGHLELLNTVAVNLRELCLYNTVLVCKYLNNNVIYSYALVISNDSYITVDYLTV